MIANEIDVGSGFKGVIRYNVEGRRDAPSPERCEWIEARNLPGEDPQTNWRVMRATADLSSRTEKPVYHFSLDWHPDEAGALTRETARASADRMLDRLGLAEHQAMIFFHRDAAHPHLHVVVNRVHPETGRAWEIWKSKQRLERAASDVARDFGFEQVPGRHNKLDRERAFEDKPTRGEQRRAAREGDTALATWTGDKLAMLRKAVGNHFREAGSWADLTDRLGDHGLQLQAKGQGLIVTDGAGFAKLSQMGKDIRLSGLEKAFGQTWKQHQVQREAGWRASRALQADERVRLHRHQVNDLKLRGEQLRDSNRKSRQAEWRFTKAQETRRYHEQKLNELLHRTYRNPKQARLRLDKLAEMAGLDALSRPKRERWRAWLEAVFGRGAPKLGNLRGVSMLGMKSKARRQAEKAQRRQVARQYRKLQEAQRRADRYQMESAIAKGRAFHARADYERVRGLVGPSKHRRETARRFHSERTAAVAALRPEDVKSNGLPEPERNRLAHLYDRHHGGERGDRTSDKRSNWARFQERLKAARERDQSAREEGRNERDRDDFDRER